MGKTLVYLENLLFLLFCKFENSPNDIGKKIAISIKNTFNTVYPPSKFNGIGYAGIKQKWIQNFWEGFLKEIEDKL